MTSESVYNIQVTEQEKDLFQQWLKIRHSELLAELETVKSLLNKLPPGNNVTLYPEPARLAVTGHEVSVTVNPNPKWAAKSLKVLRDAKTHWFDSSEVVDILMKNDPLSASLPRVEVMRGVSSRLNQLVKREQAERKEIHGKIHYRWLKD